MARQFALVLLCCIFSKVLMAQSAIQLDYFNKVPVAIKNCGALYTYDTTAFSKKKYILLTDFQKKGMITVAGKQIDLNLIATKVEKSINTLTYSGAGYVIVLSTKTIKHTAKLDTEEGTLEITKGKTKKTIKIHGQSGCNDSQEKGG